MGLGDSIERALQSVGITPNRVERWVGPECGCDERKARLNQLGWWAARVLKGRVEKAKDYLEELLR